MKLHEIAQALGGDINGKWINIRGPNHSSTDRSLGFQFDKTAPGGIRVYSFAGDDPVLCREYVKAKLQSVANKESFALECDPNITDESREAQARALAIWEDAKPPSGTPVETYLTARYCPLTSAVLSGDTIRFRPACPFGQFYVPAMVGLVRDVKTGKPLGIHRTALRNDGTGKRGMPLGLPSKMAMGRVKGGAVMLQPAGPYLGVAEGIETALSAQLIFDMPVWAALSAVGVQNFPIVTGLKRLTIFADHDEAGLNAALKCAYRYSKAGIRVKIRHPETLGQDWNDFVLAKENK